MSIRAKTAHRRIAVVLLIFIAVHFATHFGALGGIEAHTAALAAGRTIYQFQPVETLLIAALAIQIMLGVVLLRQIRKRPRKSAWHYAQILSGSYLVLFITMHTSAAILTRGIAGLDTNFYWAAGTLIIEPLRYGFVPYYFLAVISLTTHLASALHFHGRRISARLALSAGPIIAVPILLAYGGAFYSVDLPQDYLDYFAVYTG